MADAAKLTNVRIARFRECRDLVRECEIFVENEAKVTSRVSGVKRRVMRRNSVLDSVRLSVTTRYGFKAR